MRQPWRNAAICRLLIPIHQMPVVHVPKYGPLLSQPALVRTAPWLQVSLIMLKDTSKLVSPWEDVVLDPLLWTQYPGSSRWPGLARWWHRRDLAGKLWLQCSPLRSTRKVPVISLWFLVEENFPCVPVFLPTSSFCTQSGAC